MLKKLLALLVVLLAAAAGYLALTPSPIDPLPWDAAPAPAMTGVLEPNDTLMKAELLAGGQVHGPEDTAVDGQGRVLLVRKHGSSTFIQPGGKREPGEDALATLARELQEELGELTAEHLRLTSRARGEPDAEALGDEAADVGVVVLWA